MILPSRKIQKKMNEYFIWCLGVKKYDPLVQYVTYQGLPGHLAGCGDVVVKQHLVAASSQGSLGEVAEGPGGGRNSPAGGERAALQGGREEEQGKSGQCFVSAQFELTILKEVSVIPTSAWR